MEGIMERKEEERRYEFDDGVWESGEAAVLHFKDAKVLPITILCN